MIDVVNYTDEVNETTYIPVIDSAYSATRELRPNLPIDIKIHFTDKGVVPGLAAGGYAYSKNIINIAIDLNEEDTSKITHDLKATIFHEAFHVSMGYTGETGPFNLIECAIQEGAATVFAIKYADSSAGKLYGNFESATENQLREWLKFAINPENQILTREEWRQFAFRDSNDNIQWKLYKLGTWVVTRYIEEKALDIKNLNSLDIEPIIKSIKQSPDISS